MESVSLGARSRDGLSVTWEGWATGAVEKPTKKDPDRVYHQLHLTPDEDPKNAVFVFCELEHAEAVAKGIKKDGAAVKVVADLVIGRKGVNVTSVKVL